MSIRHLGLRRDTAGWLAAALVIVAGIAVYHGTLRYFFGQDDFGGLARARDVMPRLSGPWRYLSGQTYFDVMARLAGLNALPYRIVSLASHVAGGLLVFALLRRFVSRPAAWLGAIFYAAHPAHYTAVYSVSGIGELLAPAFAMASLLVLDAPGRWRWTALPLFAASLGCKETTVLLPLAALLLPARGSGTLVNRDRLRDPMWLAVIAVALVYGIALVAADPFGVGSGLASAEPYAPRFDATLTRNLFTYLGWTANLFLPTVRSFTDRIEPAAYPWGVAAAVLAVASLAIPAVARRGAAFGVAWFALAILPVLPLANHTYHYYLVTPLVGAAAWLGAVFDAALGPRASGAPADAGPAAAGKHSKRSAARRAPVSSTRRVPSVAGLVAAAVAGALLTLNGVLLVHRIETYPFVDPDLRSDSTVDRARIARNVRDDLGSAALPPGTVLRFWSPASIDRAVQQGGDPSAETYWEKNVRNALLEDIGVRTLFPAVTRVEFTRGFEPAGDSVRYAVYRPDGHLRVARPAELDSVLKQVGG